MRLVAVVVSGVVARCRVFACLFEGVFGGGVIVGIATEVSLVIMHLNFILLLKNEDNAKSKQFKQTIIVHLAFGKKAKICVEVL